VQYSQKKKIKSLALNTQKQINIELAKTLPVVND